MKKLLIVAVFLMMAGVFVLAQSAEYSACEDLESRVGTVQELAAALDFSAESISEDMAGLGREISLLDAACRGLSFSSEVDGSQPVLGPMILEEGVYRVTLTTDGFVTVKGTELDGSCERDIDLLYNEFEGDAADGSQVVLDLDDDCEVLLEFSNITDDWTMTFEKLR